MTKITPPDKIVSAMVDEFFKTLHNLNSPKVDEAPTTEADPKEDSPLSEDAPVVPYTEAIRILKDVEERAVDQGDTDLALAVADRYIEIGRQLLS